jgi:hypothetical protein
MVSWLASMVRVLLLVLVAGCAARPLQIDRFGAGAQILARTKMKGLPAPNAPIDMERRPFITQGLGPDGKPVRYYNFDVQPRRPALVYRLTRDEQHAPIEGQDMIVDTVPGEAGHSDFLRVVWVTVPAGFVGGSAHSLADLAGWPAAPSQDVLDCPIVPARTHARGAKERSLWYRGQGVTCLFFGDPLTLGSDGLVPVSPIYVTFGTDGFQTETGTPQTHNVVFSVPGDLDYSPLWDVHVYDPARFAEVKDANTAAAAPVIKNGGTVNCPIVDVFTR